MKRTQFCLRIRFQDSDPWGEPEIYETRKERDRKASFNRIIGGVRTFSYEEKDIPAPTREEGGEGMSLSLLIIAHLVGDFLLQNHWMQTKAKNSFVCTVHVLCYSACFWFLLPWYLVVAILIEHWLQDRFALHLKWMALYRQTMPDKWPVGPLCMDQSFHLTFIAMIYLMGVKP